MTAVAAFLKKHPARVYAVLVAVLACLPAVVGGIPTTALAGIVAAILGLGNTVQTVEDGKTNDAANGGV